MASCRNKRSEEVLPCQRCAAFCAHRDLTSCSGDLEVRNMAVRRLGRCQRQLDSLDGILLGEIL